MRNKKHMFNVKHKIKSHITLVEMMIYLT